MYRHVSTSFLIACSLSILSGCPQPSTKDAAVNAKEEVAKPAKTPEPPRVTVTIDPVIEAPVEVPMHVSTEAKTETLVADAVHEPVVETTVEVTVEPVAVAEQEPVVVPKKNALPNYLVFKTGTVPDLSGYEMNGDEVLLRCSYSNKAIANRDMLVTAKYFDWLKSDDVGFEKDGILRAKVGSASCRVVLGLQAAD